jgi:hypothetical protein
MCRLARAAARSAEPEPLTDQAIEQLMYALGDLGAVIWNADPTEKGTHLRELELWLTYQPGRHLVHTTSTSVVSALANRMSRPCPARIPPSWRS